MAFSLISFLRLLIEQETVEHRKKLMILPPVYMIRKSLRNYIKIWMRDAYQESINMFITRNIG